MISQAGSTNGETDCLFSFLISQTSDVENSIYQINTSVDFLLGRTDCLTLPCNNTLSDSESNLLYHFRRLSAQKQQRVIGYIEAIKDMS